MFSDKLVDFDLMLLFVLVVYRRQQMVVARPPPKIFANYFSTQSILVRITCTFKSGLIKHFF
jgi:hypothetical protein